MNPLNSQIMEKDTEKKEVIKREVTTLEIAYHKREELVKLREELVKKELKKLGKLRKNNNL